MEKLSKASTSDMIRTAGRQSENHFAATYEVDPDDGNEVTPRSKKSNMRAQSANLPFSVEAPPRLVANQNFRAIEEVVAS